MIKIVNSRTRRVLQAVLYELIAIAAVGPGLSYLFSEPVGSSMGLAVVFASVALVWSYMFNKWFEHWESAQTTKGRAFGRRLIHGLGFEGGLVLILVPIMAWWLDTTWMKAFLADLGIFAFFFVYSVVFTWVFDRIFGLPSSASDEVSPPS